MIAVELMEKLAKAVEKNSKVDASSDEDIKDFNLRTMEAQISLK